MGKFYLFISISIVLMPVKAQGVFEYIPEESYKAAEEAATAQLSNGKKRFEVYQDLNSDGQFCWEDSMVWTTITLSSKFKNVPAIVCKLDINPRLIEGPIIHAMEMNKKAGQLYAESPNFYLIHYYENYKEVNDEPLSHIYLEFEGTGFEILDGSLLSISALQDIKAERKDIVPIYRKIIEMASDFVSDKNESLDFPYNYYAEKPEFQFLHLEHESWGEPDEGIYPDED